MFDLDEYTDSNNSNDDDDGKKRKIRHTKTTALANSELTG
jgi:hypothetical protein